MFVCVYVFLRVIRGGGSDRQKETTLTYSPDCPEVFFLGGGRGRRQGA